MGPRFSSAGPRAALGPLCYACLYLPQSSYASYSCTLSTLSSNGIFSVITYPICYHFYVAPWPHHTGGHGECPADKRYLTDNSARSRWLALSTWQMKTRWKPILLQAQMRACFCLVLCSFSLLGRKSFAAHVSFRRRSDQAQRVSRPFRSSSPSWRQTQVRVRCGTSSADSAARPQRTAPYFPAPSYWGPQALTCRRALSSATHPLSPSLKSKLNDSASTLRHKTHFTLNSLSLKLYWWLFLKQSHSKTPGCWAFLKPLQTVSAEHHTASHGRLCGNDEKRGQTVGKANCPRQLLFTLQPCQPRDMLRDPWSTQ